MISLLIISTRMSIETGYRIAANSRQLRRLFDERVRDLGLTGPQARLLLALERHPAENQAFYAERLEIEPITLTRIADRLDDIKSQLGGMGDTRAIRALEEKLVTVAAALEHIGAHIDPNERMVMEQFAALDTRLDEITRAIAAGSRNSGPGNDPATFHRLEERLAGLARQIEDLPAFDCCHRAQSQRFPALGTGDGRVRHDLIRVSNLRERMAWMTRLSAAWARTLAATALGLRFVVAVGGRRFAAVAAVHRQARFEFLNAGAERLDLRGKGLYLLEQRDDQHIFFC